MPKTNLRWTEERAWEWSAKRPLAVGCNFIPSTAVNQLEMWQAETFDPDTIDRELGFAESIGMNTVRVYLHNLLWEHEADAFKCRIERYLEIAARRGIQTMFVLFDSCWNDHPQLGPQAHPRPGVHNSGWVQGPGSVRLFDPSTWGGLESYTKDILASFDGDERVLAWDLFNEASHGGYGDKVVPLLSKTFEWAREVNPSQPLTSARWEERALVNEVIFNNSDIITFHNYESPESLEAQIVALQALGRPILCTEYMARTTGSCFDTCLPIFLKHGVGAVHWGLVNGRTNTTFGWEAPLPDVQEPDVWFHDILRADGTAYCEAEVECLRRHAAAARTRRLSLD